MGSWSLGCGEDLNYSGPGRASEGALAEGVMDAWQPRREAMGCGLGDVVWGLESNTLLKVLYKNLDKATHSLGRRILSFSLAETETILRKTNKMIFGNYKNPFFEATIVSQWLADLELVLIDRSSITEQRHGKMSGHLAHVFAYEHI